MTRIMAVASVALIVAAVAAIAQPRSDLRREVEFLRAATERVSEPVRPIFIAPPHPPAPLGPALTLPIGTSARLTSIPDALLNDPPAARFRAVTEVRGRTGLFTIDAPLVLAWSEDGYWYELSTMRLTLRQLIDLASALE